MRLFALGAAVLSVATAGVNWKREPCGHGNASAPVALYRQLDGTFTPDTSEAASRGFVVIGLVLLAAPSWLRLTPRTFFAAYVAVAGAWFSIHVGSHDLCSPKCSNPAANAGNVTLGPGVFLAYMTMLSAVASLVSTHKM